MSNRMKVVLLLPLFAAIVLAVPTEAQEGGVPLEGHVIEGDTLTFLFDESLYPAARYDMVSVVGNFNGWDGEAPGWQLADEDGDGVWTLDVTLGEGIIPGAAFHFAINERYGTPMALPAGVDRDFVITDNDGSDHLIVGGLESFLSNDPIANSLKWLTFAAASGTKFDYYLHTPENYDSTQPYPLVLSLHGWGEGGDSPGPILPYNGAYEFLKTAASNDFFMLVPQAPRQARWAAPSVRQALYDLIAATQQEYPIDPARIYIIGLSAGGYGLWDQVSHAPDLYAAGLSVCGGWPLPPIDVGPIKHIPFWLFHGTDDFVVPPIQSRAIVRALEEAGGTVKFTEYEGAGHWVFVQTYSNPEVIDWLFSQHKS